MVDRRRSDSNAAGALDVGALQRAGIADAPATADRRNYRGDAGVAAGPTATSARAPPHDLLGVNAPDHCCVRSTSSQLALLVRDDLLARRAQSPKRDLRLVDREPMRLAGCEARGF